MLSPEQIKLIATLECQIETLHYSLEADDMLVQTLLHGLMSVFVNNIDNTSNKEVEAARHLGKVRAKKLADRRNEQYGDEELTTETLAGLSQDNQALAGILTHYLQDDQLWTLINELS